MAKFPAGPRTKNFQKSLKMSNPSLRMESKKALNYWTVGSEKNEINT